MSAPERVVITGIGLSTPLGGAWPDFCRAVFGGGARFESLSSGLADTLPVARVDEDLLPGLGRTEAKLTDRHARLAVLAARRALDQAGLLGHPALCAGVGVYLGSGAGPTESTHRAHQELWGAGGMHGLSLLRCMPSGAAASVALHFGLRGPNLAPTAACASSAMALGEALRAVRHGYLPLALAGGAEAPFGGSALQAWQGLRVLAPAGDDPGAACRPFDRDRRGLVLGEGAALFVLEAEGHARDRGAEVLAVINGYGASCDAHHWTEPHAEGQCQAMRAALDDARLKPADVHAINAHGTGTLAGDEAEAESIARVFGPPAQAPWVHASKSLHGHLLGASGAIELAVAIACLHAGRLPPTRNLLHPSTDLLRLVMQRPAALGPATGGATSPGGLGGAATLLSNSFAFGGANACLAISAARRGL